MKIAVLNESFLKDKHISKLKQLGEVVIYSKTDTEELFSERLKGVEVAIADCFEAPLNGANIYTQIPSVRLITLNSTGFDLVDIVAAKNNSVLIANVPGFSTEGVAEHALALLLATIRHIPEGDKAMRVSPFQIDPANREHDRYLGIDLKGKTLGVVGLGQIGTRVAEIGLALGMQVIGHNRSPRDISGVRMVSLEQLLKESDFISLNVALMEGINELIDESKLRLMKKTAYLINTARGGLVDDDSLAKVLREKKIAGAGLDFLKEWKPDNPLLKLDNVVFTPHVGWFTEESLNNMADIIVSNVESYVKGKPDHIVNP